MHYSYTIPGRALRPAITVQALAMPVAATAGERIRADRRWPRLMRALTSLRERGRRSIRIVDAQCGSGELLIEAAACARGLGFVAIEAHGTDRDAATVARARATGRGRTDPAIGITFAVDSLDHTLREEAAFPADIILCDTLDPALHSAALSAGKLVLNQS
jgi:hypothetical protein